TTAANLAAPNAQVCPDVCTFIGMSMISASICMTQGAFLATPPKAIIPFTGMCRSTKHSTLYLAPQQVDPRTAGNHKITSVDSLRLGKVWRNLTRLFAKHWDNLLFRKLYLFIVFSKNFYQWPHQ